MKRSPRLLPRRDGRGDVIGDAASASENEDWQAVTDRLKHLIPGHRAAPTSRTAADRPIESDSARSKRSAVSPPQWSASARMKCEWFGSSGALPAAAGWPGPATLPAGATPSSTGRRSRPATAFPLTAMTPDSVPPSMMTAPAWDAARATPSANSSISRSSRAGSRVSAPPITTRTGEGTWIPIAESSSSGRVRAVARRARAWFPLGNSNVVAPSPSPSGPPCAHPPVLASWVVCAARPPCHSPSSLQQGRAGGLRTLRTLVLGTGTSRLGRSTSSNDDCRALRGLPMR